MTEWVAAFVNTLRAMPAFVRLTLHAELFSIGAMRGVIPRQTAPTATTLPVVGSHSASPATGLTEGVSGECHEYRSREWNVMRVMASPCGRVVFRSRQRVEAFPRHPVRKRQSLSVRRRCDVIAFHRDGERKDGLSGTGRPLLAARCADASIAFLCGRKSAQIRVRDPLIVASNL